MHSSEWKELVPVEVERQAGQWHMAVKELLPIVLACLLWGKEWLGMRVQCFCDNTAAVKVMKGGYSRDTVMMNLWRWLSQNTLSFWWRWYTCLVN